MLHRILRSRCFVYVALIITGLWTVSCQSDSARNNQVLNDAIQAVKAQEAVPASDSGKLAIQNSAYTGPVKQVPTQEELIAACRVKSVKESYDGGWSLTVYDNKGHEISYETDYGSKRKYAYTFDKDGRVKQKKTTYSDKSTTRVDHEYNDEGKLIKKTYTDDEGKVSVTTFDYNTSLNTRTEHSSSGMDKEFYDNRGLRVRFESYDDQKKLIGSGEATYTEEGLKASEASVIIGMNTNDVMSYNERGQLLEQRRTGILDVHFMFEYNEKGLIIRERTIKGGKAETMLYEYTYY